MSPLKSIGGRGGIRTPDGIAPTPDFESGALNHSATLPAISTKERRAEHMSPGFASEASSFAHSSLIGNHRVANLNLTTPSACSTQSFKSALSVASATPIPPRDWNEPGAEKG